MIGCGPSQETLYKMFQDENPAVRLRAVRQAGTTKDTTALPYLVDRLTDTESEVRFFAILALEKITGERKGYKYYGSGEDRAAAAGRWRDWVKQRRERQASTKPAEGL